jgi:hypothetical protein
MLFSRRLFLAAATSSGFVGKCGSNSPAPPGPPPPSPSPPGTVTFDFSFTDDLAGWEPDVADYPVGDETAIDFSFGQERLPDPLGDGRGFYMQSRNEPDDVFLYASRLLDGLRPATTYRIGVRLRFATNAPPDCFGIGGAPGEAVIIKTGASAVRPAHRVEEGLVRVNFDKGAQTESGEDVVAIGNFAQETPGGDCLAPFYQLKTLTLTTGGPQVRSDSSGRLWLVIGTDSGFEGITRIYFLDGSFTLTPS